RGPADAGGAAAAGRGARGARSHHAGARPGARHHRRHGAERVLAAAEDLPVGTRRGTARSTTCNKIDGMVRLGGLLVICAHAVEGGVGIDAQTKKAPAAPAPKREMPVPFKAGEVLEFDVGWSSYVTAGTAVVSVKEK